MSKMLAVEGVRTFYGQIEALKAPNAMLASPSVGVVASSAKKRSKLPLIIGSIAVVVACGMGAFFFVRSQSSTPATSAKKADTTAKVEDKKVEDKKVDDKPAKADDKTAKADDTKAEDTTAKADDTKADDTNTSGASTGNAMAWAVSALPATSPRLANTQVSENPK